MPAPVLQFKRGNAGVGGTVPALRPGEPALSLNNFDLFVGFNSTVSGNRFFGSHRYWGREDGTTSLRLKLVDRTGVGGTIELKTPDSHTGVTTYTFPSTPVAGNFLKVDANGQLSWDTVTTSASFSNASLTGVTTITGRLDNQANTTSSGIVTYTNTTDNTLGNSNTGAVQIDGGLGIDKNLTVGANLNVQGYSNFVGVVTFQNTITGTISTATKATLVDTTTAPNGTFYPGLFLNNTGTASTAVYVDSGISYVSNTDTLTLTGDIAVNGGDVTTSAGTFNLINSNATNVNFGGAATSLVMGATSGIATINNPTLVGTQATQNLYNTVATTLNLGGAATALNMGAATGTATINNPTVVGSATTQNLYNTTATSLNFGGAATALNMGATSGIATINNATLTLPNATTVNVNGASPTFASSSTGTLTFFNNNITSVNEYGAATNIVMGATSGIATIRNATLSLPNATTVNVDGANPTLASSSTGLLTLFNTNLTRVNAFQAATDIVLAATTGITTIRNNLQVNGTSTFTGSVTGTISTATRSTLVDTTTAPNGTFYPGLFLNNTGTASTAVYVDAGISYVSNTDTLTLTGNLAVNGGTVTSTGTAATVFDSNVSTVNAFGQATSIGIGSTAATLTLRPSTVVGTNATQNLYNSVATALNLGGAATSLVMGATSGIATINNPTVVGSQASQNLYNTVATTLNFGGAATALNMGASTGTLTINNPTVVGSATTQNLYNSVATSLNLGGAATALNMGATSGIATINNTTLTLPNATTVNVNGANPTLASSSTGTLTLFNTNLTSVNAFGAATSLVIGSASGITTFGSVRITNNLRDSSNSAGSTGQFLQVTQTGIGWTTISGVSAGTISTATRAQTVDSVSTSDTGTFFPALFSSSSAGAGVTAYVDAGISFDASANTLTLGGSLAVNGGNVTTTSSTANIVNANATTVNFAGAASNLVIASASGITTVRNKLTVGGNLEVDGNNIQSSTGANVITLSGSTASFASDVTVGGNLFVNGTTTQVNTSELQVYDRTITLGIQSGTTPATTTWDLGILMNYGDAGVAKTAGVVWETANKRFQFSASSNNLAGISTDTPQVSVTTFAPIEIAELWVNNTCTGGTQQVIGCVGSELQLNNITVDAGTF